jgi:hypothetical protein
MANDIYSPDDRRLLAAWVGAIGPDEDWCEAVGRVLVDDWRFQFSEWDQSPWAYVWHAGLVTTDEAMAWRREAWDGHEEFAAEEAVEEEAG